MLGEEPGLMGTTKVVMGKELYTEGHTVSWRRPRVQQLRSDVLVLERAYEHFVDGGKKNLSKRLVGAVVIVEECGRSVESIAKFGDLGDSGVGWDVGCRAGVDGNDKCGDE